MRKQMRLVVSAALALSLAAPAAALAREEAKLLTRANKMKIENATDMRCGVTAFLLKEKSSGRKVRFAPSTQWIDAKAAGVLEAGTTYLNDDQKNGCIVKVLVAVAKRGKPQAFELSPAACGESEYRIVQAEGRYKVKFEKVK